MPTELLYPLLAFLKEDTGLCLSLAVLLIIGITAGFARRNTLRFYQGLLKVIGRYLIAPFRFVSKYVALTHDQHGSETLPWVSNRAPLTMANLDFLNSITAFAGILILASTLLLGGRVLLPDLNIGRTIRFINLQMEIERPEQTDTSSLLGRLQEAEKTGTRGYQDLRNARVAILMTERNKYNDVIAENPSAKAELERITKTLNPLPETVTFSDIDAILSQLDNIEFKTKDAYYNSCILADLNCTYRIKYLQYDWNIDSLYNQLLIKDHDYSMRFSSDHLNSRLSELAEANEFRWKAMATTLLTGVFIFWTCMWLCGLIIEGLNLVLGHLEWAKQTQEAAKNAPGNAHLPILEQYADMPRLVADAVIDAIK